ncbi:ribbon-helix-helix protein, CopG family [Glycomyces arizonensis]
MATRTGKSRSAFVREAIARYTERHRGAKGAE